MAIELTKETTDELIPSIQKFFGEEFDEEIGNLRSQRILEFILIEIGPSIYNKAIKDAQAYVQDRLLDLDGACFEPEMTYWTEKGR
jgi:uncharacterized protein (DUF2164 family)